MSISNSLVNALSGMSAASRLAEVVSSNVANSFTEGYGRRSLNLSSQSGVGVLIGTVDRIVDRGILANRRLSDAAMGQFNSLASTMGELQNVVGTVGDGDSISSRIVAVESALIDAASDPSSPLRLSTLNDRLAGLASGLNQASDRVQSMRVEQDKSIADQVDQLNSGLEQIERLNADITYSINTNRDASGIMDQRQQVIDKIAAIVPIREMDRDGGQVALMTPDGQVLLDGTARSFEFTQNPFIIADMTLENGMLSGVMLEGEPLGADGVGKLAGGTLSAAFDARDGELVRAQANLDNVAADLVGRFQDPAVDPTLAVGDPGLLTDAGAAFDPADVTGLAGRISLNAAVDPSQGGTLTNLRDGVAATAPGPSGNATLFQSLSNALMAPRTTLGDPIPQGASGRASMLEAEIGSQRLSYESELSFATARWSSLKEAEAAGGVDTDREMQMLLRVEQAYAANARIVQTVESMMQTLMEI